MPDRWLRLKQDVLPAILTGDKPRSPLPPVSISAFALQPHASRQSRTSRYPTSVQRPRVSKRLRTSQRLRAGRQLRRQADASGLRAITYAKRALTFPSSGSKLTPRSRKLGCSADTSMASCTKSPANLAACAKSQPTMTAANKHEAYTSPVP